MKTNYLLGSAVALSMSFAMAFSSCREKDEPDPVRPVEAESIVLSEEAVTLEIGQSVVLTATVSPDNADDKTVEWSSGNPNVAEVDASGKVTAVAAGDAVVKAAAAGGKVGATCAVTVGAAHVPVESVVLNTTSAEMKLGGTLLLEATVAPADATAGGVVWSSGNTEVATVDERGEVKAVGAGEAIITAEADGVAATCSVTVAAEVYIVYVESNNTSFVWKDGEATELADGGIAAVANDICVTPEGDVYVVGYDTPDDTGISRAVVWKNGAIEYLSDGTKDVQAKSVTAVGGRVYIAGNEVGTANKVYLWIDSEPSVLPSQGNYAEANGVYVSPAGGIYVAGYDNGAVLWAGGMPSALDSAASLMSVTLCDGKIYMAGYRNNEEYITDPMLWIDGEGRMLDKGGSADDDIYANAVFVSATGDVYVAGNNASSTKLALLWKNGAQEVLAGGYKAFDVAVWDGTVYVAGSVGEKAAFPPVTTAKAAMWKDGEMTKFSDAKSEARAIFVRTK